MADHEHVFRPAALTYDDDGTPIEGGRRCSCGVEVVGSGLLSLNANLVRASRSFNQAAAKAVSDLGARMEANRRRMFPDG